MNCAAVGQSISNEISIWFNIVEELCALKRIMYRKKIKYQSMAIMMKIFV